MVEQLQLNGIPAESIPLPVPAPGPGFVRSPSPEPLFLYCGRLDQAKGVDLLLQTFATVLAARPAARLQVLGDGPRRGQLQSLAEKLGIAGAIRFDGQVAFAGVETALAQAWALVAPSVWPEPLGLVAIEAITHGVPVIASASGGFAETVEHGVSGLLVANGDQRALTDCLMSAVDRGPTTIPEDIVRSLRSRHDAARHGARLAAIFGEAIGRRRDLA
jgi:glycosyltransferase involved in cell wall biosynthesis